MSFCTGRPWRQQLRQSRLRQAAAAAYEPAAEPSTAAYAEYDDRESSPTSDQNLQEPQERDYGEPERPYAEPERVYAEPEQNYEVDEAVSVLSDGRVHGVQRHRLGPSTAAAVTASFSATAVTTTTTTTTTSTAGTAVSAETRKSGYVVDGKHYRKYRVEEETPDGFIVGEYGVVSHRDGTTRGVRYTADSSINPRVIYEALAKFLALRRR